MKKIHLFLPVALLTSLAQNINGALVPAEAISQLQVQVGNKENVAMLEKAVDMYTALTGNLYSALFAATTAHQYTGIGLDPKEDFNKQMAGFLSIAYLAGVATKLALKKASKSSFVGSFTDAAGEILNVIKASAPNTALALTAIGIAAKANELKNKFILPALTSSGSTIKPLD